MLSSKQIHKLIRWFIIESVDALSVKKVLSIHVHFSFSNTAGRRSVFFIDNLMKKYFDDTIGMENKQLFPGQDPSKFPQRTRKMLHSWPTET